MGGSVVYDSANDPTLRPNLLHWPPPLTTSSYALVDHPRFFVPEWGPTPMPDAGHVDPALRPTNGYDFRNVVEGDTYVFLLGQDLKSWGHSRVEFLTLTGPTPLLPDYAFGIWYTWWHPFTEEEAKEDIQHWEAGRFPLDVWGLDLNWRNISGDAEHYYSHPNVTAFPDLAGNGTAWFSWLRSKKLRTYLSDHPFPVAGRGAGGLQTSPEEVAFRWEGLSQWMSRGATWWWFDVNWGFSIPPPTLNDTSDWAVWEGLDSAAWGSHVYFRSIEVYDRFVCDRVGDDFYGRPVLLSKFTCGDPGGRWGPLNWGQISQWAPDGRVGPTNGTMEDPRGHSQSPSQHRYPVWWTGDYVSLQASVESMVDSGLHDFKPYVHSDCGGDRSPQNPDRHPSSGSLMRWTAHCAFGTIFRYHGTDHRLWLYPEQTQTVVRDYLNMRYRLMPSIIAAGHDASISGFPLVARCDMLWPELAEQGSASNHQYVFLQNTLVAPIVNDNEANGHEPVHQTNITTRDVWIPPGEWEDVWTGAVISGPRHLNVTQPFERQPMWHRRPSLSVMCDQAALRVDDQDWDLLTLDAFPELGSAVQAAVIERGTGARTDLTLTTDVQGRRVALNVNEAGDGSARGWILRLHLRLGQQAQVAIVDGVTEAVVHKEPVMAGANYVPFAGSGSSPAHLAGPVVEVSLPRASHARTVTVELFPSSPGDHILPRMS